MSLNKVDALLPQTIEVFSLNLPHMAKRKKSKKVEETWDGFSTFLTSKGLRVTGQRRGIFDALFEEDGHFTAEQLLVHARNLDDTVSRATVYRSLPLLVESGVVREVDVGHDNKFYTVNLNSENFKAQVVCLDCDTIYEVDAPFMEWYGKTVSEKLGLDVQDQRLQVRAECTQFQHLGSCDRNK